ncbi:O-antigen ligase family protein [Halopseudomonas nanhaiensis]|uniref:O-antigen ligase family protein n=1 Tax=Halopseudomonas nanhaiensis TaxID=2830842 RepID=UPI001CBAA2F2|nr:O-antigen ligase family protein [Halopseudomonas nanhaiensis]UAW99097.1 O-antigen ligase family protein [Halopseudomonas nanhaiensis]
MNNRWLRALCSSMWGLRFFFPVRNYFTSVLLLFLAAFLFFPTAKSVNNFYYVFLGFPAFCLLLCGKGLLRRYTVALLLWLCCLSFMAVLAIADASFGYFKHHLYIFLFCSLIVLWVDPDKFDGELFAFAAFWSLVIFIVGSAVFYWATDRFLPGSRLVVLPGNLSGPILTSMILVGLYALAIPGRLIGRRWSFIVSGAFAVIFCVGYILQSRSGLLGFFATAVIMFMWLLLKSSGWTRMLLVFGALICVVVLFLGASHLPFASGLIERSDAGRIELWLAYLNQLYMCGIWLGCGDGNDVAVTIENGSVLIQHPHNLFLAIAVHSGVPAVLLFVGALSETLRQAWLQRNPWGGYLGVAILMLMFDGNKLIDNPSEIWLLVFFPAMMILAREQHISE